jgi:ribosomal protein L12E/L44/L45/RPP1/RPP2
MALYLVPRYENRRKSLTDVNSKLKSTIERANLGVHISELRQAALEAAILRLEELKKAVLDQNAKKDDKKEPKDKKGQEKAEGQTEQTDKPRSIFEDEIKSNKSLFSDETDTPDSDSGKKLW